MAGGIGAGAVDFRRVFAGESAAAVPGDAAVGVHQNLAPGQAGVPLRAAHREPAAGVHENLGVAVQQVIGDDGADDVFLDVAADFGVKGIVVGVVIVLGADDHRIDAAGPAVAVFDSDLRLSVRADVVQQPGLADGGQLLHQPVRQIDGARHQLIGFVAGKADHHPLVSGAGGPAGGAGGAAPFLQGGGHAGADVGRLLAHMGDDAAGVAVDAVLHIGVANLPHHPPGDGVEVDGRLGGHFAGDHNQVLGRHRFAGHAAHRVIPQRRVQHRIGNLVAQLVGVALGDRLGGEQILGRGHKLNGHRLLLLPPGVRPAHSCPRLALGGLTNKPAVGKRAPFRCPLPSFPNSAAVRR